VKLLVILFLQAHIASSLLGQNVKNCSIYAYKYLTVTVKTTNACTYVSVNINLCSCVWDRLCGLVVRVSGYRLQRSRVRSPALPDFLSSRGSGTGSTQPREVN